MKLFNRYEKIGILASILLVVVVLVGIRFFPSIRPSFLALRFPFSKSQTQTGNQDEIKSATTSTAQRPGDENIIRIDPKAKDKQAALKNAILDGSTGEGYVRKLIISDTKVGKGKQVKIGDTVRIDYIGLVKDGPEFANTYKTKKRFSFKVGAGDVIEGLDEGIIGMKEDGVRTLIVPASMGYGNVIVDPIPANAALVLSVELVSIR